MIVQSASENETPFVITMAAHMTLAGQFARAFGNDRFEAIEPREEVLYIIDHHDAGWADLDGRGLVDGNTGLPFNLVDTPMERIVETSSASPDYNSRRHAYCGLLSSMHSWGLYNGRYGMSDRVLLNAIAESQLPAAQRMLDEELARQERLKAALAQDPETAEWVEDGHLFQNYKQLQFCDTMALYFNCTHEGARGETVFEHVPESATSDVSISVKPMGEGDYRLSPYPFAEDGLEFSFSGRYMEPDASRDSVDLDTVSESRQQVRVVAA